MIDNLQKFGMEFQLKCITSLISDKSFLERINDIVDPMSFEADTHLWIVKQIVAYFIQYKELPTLDVFKVKIDESKFKDEFKQSIIDQLRVIYNKITDSDIKYIKEQFLEFCKNQAIKNAILSSVNLLEEGNYDKIKLAVDNAMKAGMERNIGHEYNTDVDARMSLSARNTLKTNWTEIDTILDGGLAAGELGVITACAGSGKCVGPNTEIEIAYDELGIEVIGNSGNPHVIWINPYKKYKFDDKDLFGWQIGNVIYELEKIKESATSVGIGK